MQLNSFSQRVRQIGELFLLGEQQSMRLILLEPMMNIKSKYCNTQLIYNSLSMNGDRWSIVSEYHSKIDFVEIHHNAFLGIAVLSWQPRPDNRPDYDHHRFIALLRMNTLYQREKSCYSWWNPHFLRPQPWNWDRLVDWLEIESKSITSPTTSRDYQAILEKHSTHLKFSMNLDPQREHE